MAGRDLTRDSARHCAWRLSLAVSGCLWLEGSRNGSSIGDAFAVPAFTQLRVRPVGGAGGLWTSFLSWQSPLPGAEAMRDDDGGNTDG